MRATVVLSSRGQFALAERVELLREALDEVDVIVASRPADVVNRLERGTLTYLLDVNRITVGVAVALRAQRRPYVVDTGDDPAALARATRGGGTAAAHAALERVAVKGAKAIVCRGSFHQPVLRAKTSAPIWCAPDTVPDSLLDGPFEESPQPDLVATFGSAAAPRHGDRAYGWEVIDLAATISGARGLIVVRGTGAEALRARARRFGVSDRVAIEGPRPLAELAARLAPVGFVTSVQSDDVAGWVRTTGKLPVALGLGKVLLTTRVGEATRVLPECFLIEPRGDERVVHDMARAVTRGIPPNWATEARRLAERFRRSGVAEGLRTFLAGV